MPQPLRRQIGAIGTEGKKIEDERVTLARVMESRSFPPLNRRSSDAYISVSSCTPTPKARGDEGKEEREEGKKRERKGRRKRGRERKREKGKKERERKGGWWGRCRIFVRSLPLLLSSGRGMVGIWVLFIFRRTNKTNGTIHTS